MQFTSFNLTNATKVNQTLDLSLRPCRLPVLSSTSRRITCRRQIVIPSSQAPMFRLPAIQNQKLANFLTVGKSVIPNANKLPDIKTLKRVAKIQDTFREPENKKEYIYNSTPIVIKGYMRKDYELIRGRLDNITHRSGYTAPECSLASESSFTESCSMSDIYL